MFAGAAKADITPNTPVEMDGMIRSHPSTGIHDPIHARALVFSNTNNLQDAFAIIGIDICLVSVEEANSIRKIASKSTGIPFAHIILSASHTHSGPAAVGIFNPPATEYVESVFREGICNSIEQAAKNLKPALIGVGHGIEDTISQYRRLLADDGHIVMNWEAYPPEHLVGPTGAVDPALGVIKIVSVDDASEVIALVFNHAGHPNVLSGENYLISADYPGRAMELLDRKFGGISIFTNGAQGTMDIDGLKDRDFEGLERIGRALAEAVSDTAKVIKASEDLMIKGASVEYEIPARQITDAELVWAESIIADTGGKTQAMPDGIGDDYRAVLYKKLRGKQHIPYKVEHICFAVGDTAFISVGAELFTEIGMRIKQASPFTHTYIIGLANDSLGYVPDHKAISLGGYEVDIRALDDRAEDLIMQNTLDLLGKVYEMQRDFDRGFQYKTTFEIPATHAERS